MEREREIERESEIIYKQIPCDDKKSVRYGNSLTNLLYASETFAIFFLSV